MIRKFKFTAWHVLLLMICAGVLITVFAFPPEKSGRVLLYDTKADGMKQIADALATATRDHKRVLIQFGANWCTCCYQVHVFFKTDPEISAVLKAGFVFVLVDVDDAGGRPHNADVIVRYSVPVESGLPEFVVLDADGAQLTTRETGSLSMDDHHDPARVLAFLKKWSPGESTAR
jgi:thiol:disulfide interchange protein